MDSSSKSFPEKTLEITSIQVDTGQGKKTVNNLMKKSEIAFITQAINILFSFNNSTNEDMVFSSFLKDYKTNILLCTDDKNNL